MPNTMHHVYRPRRAPASRVAVAVGVVLALAVIGGGVLVTTVIASANTGKYSASSTAGGSQLGKLGTAGGRGATWRSGGAGVGSWVRWTPGGSTTVNHVRITGVSNAASRLTAAVLQFSNGSSLAVHGNAKGDVDVRFAARSVTWVRLAVAAGPTGANPAAIARWTMSNDGGVTPAKAAVTTATATLAGSTATIPALTDARATLAAGGTGSSWTAATPGTKSVVLHLPKAAEIASLQLYGGGAAIKSGSAKFSDGSSVLLQPIAAGRGAPTTVAFTPRVTTQITVTLTPREPDGTVGLREMAAYATGVTPPVWPTTGGISTPVAAVQDCSGATGSATSQLRLICPATSGTVDGASVVAVTTQAGATVQATAVVQATGTAQAIASATADGSGVAKLSFDSTVLPNGPVTLRVTSSVGDPPLYVQLVNQAGTALAGASTASVTKGMTLAYDDEFSSPLSISASGAGTRYAATKPTSKGGSEFGDAIFTDPATSSENLSTVADKYLRIRTTPLTAGETDPAGFDRKYRGGILSSASISGGGFSAQYGYYEARMLAPAAAGTWPGFWMMTDGFLQDSSKANSEVDAVELYGHDSSYSCHSWGNWKGVSGWDGGKSNCVKDVDDWAMTWHTYGVRIGPTGTIYYVDGKQVATGPALKSGSQPFYFMLDLDLGGGWPVNLAGSDGITDLYVDYVRVYV